MLDPRSRLWSLILGMAVATVFALGALHVASADDPASDPAPGLRALTSSTTTFTTPLSGGVYVWKAGRLLPAAHARVSTGASLVRADTSGRFEFAAEERTGQLTVVQPGYDIVQRPVYRDRSVIVLRKLVVRAIFVPFLEIERQAVQDFVSDLIERDLINAVVVDLKDEGGRVVPFAANETARAMEADAQFAFPRTTSFLEQLGEQGVYRIGRIVTFFDPWYSAWHPQHSLHNLSGGRFRDSNGNSWASPFSFEARRYNIEIGMAAAGYVDEIQYDYVRLPYESVLERSQFSEADRVATINRFAQEAGEALHQAGLAVSFDTFGVISTAGNDQGIGQSVAGVAPHLDYVSPMVYPSGWSPGSFGFAYPPAHPGAVVGSNVQATIDLIDEPGSAVVRPWLQDFTDYQSRGLVYHADFVHAQIEATAEVGGIGFMLWDPSLRYQLDALQRAVSIDWTWPD